MDRLKQPNRKHHDKQEDTYLLFRYTFDNFAHRGILS